MKEKTNVIAVVFDDKIRENTKYLLLLKHYDLERFYWEFPGGSLEDSDENEIAAVIRETKEETGLKNLDVLIQTRYFAEFKYTINGELVPVKSQLML